jgi:hypothetical protein
MVDDIDIKWNRLLDADDYDIMRHYYSDIRFLCQEYYKLKKELDTKVP